MRGSLLALLIVAAVAAVAAAAVERPWMAPELRADPASRAQALVKEMTLAEKITMVHGTSGPYVGNISPVPRLGVPAILMNDGPQGFRAAGHDGTSTAWPSGLTIAASWDREALQAWGTAMGVEFVGKGANVQLGPGLCLARVPECGRNFEYLSGEDPYLGNQLVRPAVTGIQSQGVIATAKHFINNNEETNRGFISENVDERTEFEMYLSPFQGAVDAGALAIMCSYNKINQVWSCENPTTLGYLKGDLGFGGWVMSDWGGTHSTVQSAEAGLDQEMPGDTYYGAKLQQAVTAGTVSEATLDDKVTRILTSMFTAGIFDRPTAGSIDANVTSVEHNQLARELTGRAAVLLQNDDGLLPLDAGALKSIAVLGDACQKTPITAGGGSGHVVGPYVITPLMGITNRAGAGVDVTYLDSSDIPAAVAAAKAADVAIVCTGTTSGEGHDRTNLSLPYSDDQLISAVAAAQPKTAVVVATPGAVLMPWQPSVKSILCTFMGGQETGNAVADLLFGVVNPSGKTPLSMPNKENEIGMTQAQWPGLPAGNPSQANYTEKLNVGYRWYLANNKSPRFWFGHGLSYTTFGYSALEVAAKTPADSVASVRFNLTNTGSVAGAEVPQLYLGFPAASGEPPKQLKGFAKVALDAGAMVTVEFILESRDISIWDVSSHAWAPQSGDFGIYVGSSVGDIRLTGKLTV